MFFKLLKASATAQCASTKQTIYDYGGSGTIFISMEATAFGSVVLSVNIKMKKTKRKNNVIFHILYIVMSCWVCIRIYLFILFWRKKEQQNVQK